MGINSISDLLQRKEFISSIESKKEGVGHVKPSDHLFIASMALYLNTLHKLVKESWNRFSENQQDIAQDSKENHCARSKRVAELEGQKRGIDNLQHLRKRSIAV